MEVWTKDILAAIEEANGDSDERTFDDLFPEEELDNI